MHFYNSLSFSYLMRHDESRFSILTQQNFGSNCFHANQNFVDQHRKIALRLIRFVFFPNLYVYCLFSLLYFCFTLCCSLLRIGRFDSFPLFCLYLYIFFSLRFCSSFHSTMSIYGFGWYRCIVHSEPIHMHS